MKMQCVLLILQEVCLISFVYLLHNFDVLMIKMKNNREKLSDSRIVNTGAFLTSLQIHWCGLVQSALLSVCAAVYTWFLWGTHQCWRTPDTQGCVSSYTAGENTCHYYAIILVSNFSLMHLKCT